MFDKINDKLNQAKTKASETFEKSREHASKAYEAASEQVKSRLAEPESVQAWCSWCGNHTEHVRTVERTVGRSSYQCCGCNFPTAFCRYCENMAKASSLDVKNSDLSGGSKAGKISKFFTDNWTNEFCSEHDGTIPDFSKAHDKISDLSEFDELMKPRVTNYYDIAKKTVAITGGAAAIGTGAILAAPGIAAAIGTTGLLGAASTGTAISSLSGAALTSSALANLGAGGLAIITATGAGLGGKAGFGIAHNYFKDIPDYKFVRLRERSASTPDKNHCVIVVNGWLSEEEIKDVRSEEWLEACQDWLKGLRGKGDYGTEELWHLNWEAENLHKVARWGQTFGVNGTSALTIAKAMARGSKAAATTFGKGAGALSVAQLAVNNPWHPAMLKAEKAGALLAEAIARTEGKTFTLMGHSLGARVIFFALMALATKDKQFVKNAVLMGGAVGREETESWLAASSSVSGSIYNCFSENDGVLQFAYQLAAAGTSKPAGLGKAVPVAMNVDCTEFISGHTVWKDNLPRVLDRISKTQ
ncbi:hypothetical protein MSNKSG1_02906 [Marinobacter santoriniensis NKSG1]|uniref:DUF726 domain-containing protein n=1 Tax=Marinobacter santoriniensis NKSG1 TaxID=1288826 RepID=M7CV24_9GAMM|nr:DUF726 domain-containing protein [Marinobacter santoriniensis]EMP56974.1 hypothetical protein MSNKSG1_02906 [Marinobacter santoriniensis NKSG1]